MKPSISDLSFEAFENINCAPARPSTRTALRSCPSNAFTYTHNFRRDRCKEQIEQEEVEALKMLKEKQRAEKRRPYKDEYSNVCRKIEAKYRQHDRDIGAKVFLWERSEQILNLLRTKGTTPTSDDATKHQALSRFVQTIQLGNFVEIREDVPQAFEPNNYFELTQPDLVAQYGLPFYSIIEERITQGLYSYDQPSTQAPTEEIIGINTDFWGAFLGGDKRLGHDVVFYVPESSFLYYDLIAACYVPTTEAKVLLSLSQAIQQRAFGQNAGVASKLLDNFRTKSVFNEILIKAKAILSADAGYFQGVDARRKWNGVQMPSEVQVIVDSFVKDHVEPDDAGIMTLGDCLLQLGKTSATAANKKELIAKVNETIRSTFNRGLRNDLRLPDNRTVAGWKGLKLRVAKNRDKDTGVIRESVPSVPSEHKMEGQPMQLVALVS